MGRWANKYVIGLTGNIATGKSVVRQMLQHLDAYTVDADSLSHRAMAPGAPAYKPIIDAFGQFILDADQNIDRNLLGSIVFSRPEALAKLEALVHPIVMQAVGTLISRAPQRVVVIEAIKLLETDLAQAVDAVWVVDASPETQFKRLVGPRKMSETEARQRIAAQTPQADKVGKAHVVIKNDGSAEETWRQVQAAWNAIAAKMGGAVAAPPAPVAPQAPAQPARPVAPPVTRPVAPASTVPVAPVAPTAPAQPPAPVGDLKVSVKRGMPSNAEGIANFMNASAAKNVSRMDIMMAFGQKSYLLAHDQTDRILGVMGWQVENLITRVDEFYITNAAPATPIVDGLVAAVEEASKALQSEVSYIFLTGNVTPEAGQTFLKNGYEATTIEQIKIPAWREAVQEVLTENKGARILSKRLREDRVLKPI